MQFTAQEQSSNLTGHTGKCRPQNFVAAPAVLNQHLLQESLNKLLTGVRVHIDRIDGRLQALDKRVDDMARQLARHEQRTSMYMNCCTKTMRHLSDALDDELKHKRPFRVETTAAAGSESPKGFEHAMDAWH